MATLWADESATDWVWTAVQLLLVPALVVLNGLFVAAEFALVAVRRTRVEEQVSRGVPGAKAVETVVADLSRYIAATQLGITLASLALGWVAEPALARLLMPIFEFLHGPLHLITTHSVAAALAFLLITFLHVVLGELVPKTLALQTPDRFALWLTGPLIWFTWLTRPLTILMTLTATAIIRLAGYQASNQSMVHSIEELALLIEDTEEAGLLDPEQADLVQNVFELSNKRVRDCMVPIEKLAALELTMPPDKVLDAVRSGAHTRMPVYEGSLDNIVGIVNTKNLFFLFSQKGLVILEDAMYPALFLKPDESIANALRLFRKARRPMALVRDENDKVLGLVTLEDILEEIIGEIEDEHDYPAPKLVPRRGARAPWRGPVPPSGLPSRK